MSKSTRGARVAGIASLAVSLSVGVAAPAFAVPDFAFDRIGGEDRYETAALVADEYGSKPDAIVANGQPGFYADALASNYLSGAEDAPILLTRIKELPQHTLDQLDQMNAQNVTIVGGESVVPAEQEQQLKDAGYTVTRVAGDDRFETNAKVLAADGAATGGVGLIATGFNFPDALAAGPFAYKGHSLGLSTKDDVKDVVLDALVADGVKQVLIFGGTDAVGPGVEADLASRGITVKERFAGADRSETSELAAEWALKNLNFTNKHLGVASGYTLGYGADALAGGPLEGKENAPMLITRNVDNPDDVVDYMKAHCTTLETGHLFGGPAAVSVAAEAAMEKAAQCAAPGVTTRPELVSAQITGTVRADQATPSNPAGTTIVYTFDEDVQNVTSAAGFHAYYNTRTEVTGGTVVSTSGNKVTIRFTSADTADEAAAITVATVDAGAVTDTQGQASPEGDAALGTTSGGGTTTLPAGITDAPDLLSVGNFRQAADAGKTAVTYTFDQAAFALSASGYSLITPDGTQLNGTGPAAGSTEAGGGTIAGGNGTTTFTVIFTNPDGPDDNTTAGDPTDPMITATSVVRGTIDPATVESGAATTTALAGVDNVLQAADTSASGNSVEPDLVSVTLRPGATATDNDQALFVFDQNITGVVDATKFFLYDADADTDPGSSASVNPSNRTQVLVTFAPTSADDAVGGNIVDGAVATLADNTTTPVTPAYTNEQDEVGVSNTATAPGQTSGRTNAPDLTAVNLVRGASDAFGNPGNWTAVYTFDEDVTVTTVGDFKLYGANGAIFVATNCAVTSPGTGQTAEDVDNTVTCTAYNVGGAAATSDQIGAATLGTVDDGAVTEQGGTLTNVEGAEFTKGGTGTPAA